ncbi:hypothetical protein DFH07DRAFT_764350 [Mycena maculata]|uniref:Uncharacterized protein n=1 Tax=Mycena maculata TaxID=230809 RepID=A0AAD7KEL4_9AGAR|nr:hypothetical protein DFH07DRAFT_764350 [Mycena maculata]
MSYSCCLRIDSRVTPGDTQEPAQGLSLIDDVKDKERDLLRGWVVLHLEHRMEATAEEAQTALRETLNLGILNEGNGVEPSRSASCGRYERTAKGAGKQGDVGGRERDNIGKKRDCCRCQHTPDSRTAGNIPTWSDNIVSDPDNPVTSWRALASADMTGWGSVSDPIKASALSG